MLPLLSRLPVPEGLGDEPIAVDRGDHLVTYQPVPLSHRQLWRSTAHTRRAAKYRQAAGNLAANVFAMLALPGLREKIEASPYPRLRTLLTALHGTDPVADSGESTWMA